MLLRGLHENLDRVKASIFISNCKRVTNNCKEDESPPTNKEAMAQGSGRSADTQWPSECVPLAAAG